MSSVGANCSSVVVTHVPRQKPRAGASPIRPAASNRPDRNETGPEPSSRSSASRAASLATSELQMCMRERGNGGQMTRVTATRAYGRATGEPRQRASIGNPGAARGARSRRPRRSSDSSTLRRVTTRPPDIVGAGSDGASPRPAVQPPPDAPALPSYEDGWLTDASAPEPFLSYVSVDPSVNWSDELEALHEESSRSHFLDRWTRGAILDGIGETAADATIADVGCSTGLSARGPAPALAARPADRRRPHRGGSGQGPCRRAVRAAAARRRVRAPDRRWFRRRGRQREPSGAHPGRPPCGFRDRARPASRRAGGDRRAGRSADV